MHGLGSQWICRHRREYLQADPWGREREMQSSAVEICGRGQKGRRLLASSRCSQIGHAPMRHEDPGDT